MIIGMKKVFLLIAMLAVVACTRTPETQEVVFRAELVETGSMTRAVDHNEILDLIESTYVVNFPIDLYTNEATNTYTRMEFGRTYTVPIGTFKVIGYNSTTNIGFPSNSHVLSKSPSFYTESYVTIEYGTQEYVLPVQVNSAAIVIDRSEVYRVEFKGKTDSYITMTDSDFTFSDNYGVFFINGNFKGGERVYLQVTPKTGANKVTEFIFCADQVNTGGSTYAHLESCKYYVLHPNPVTELSGVSFSLDIPSWECGLE